MVTCVHINSARGLRRVYACVTKSVIEAGQGKVNKIEKVPVTRHGIYERPVPLIARQSEGHDYGGDHRLRRARLHDSSFGEEHRRESACEGASPARAFECFDAFVNVPKCNIKK